MNKGYEVMLIRKAQPEKKKRKKWQWPYREERKKEYESAPVFVLPEISV